MTTEAAPPTWRRLTTGERAHYAPLLTDARRRDALFAVVPVNQETLRIRCTICGSRWLLPRSNRHGGTILRLLEHKATHVG